MSEVTCNGEHIGVHYILDLHDYENLPLDKVRVLATNAIFKFDRDVWQVWGGTNSPGFAMPAGEYLYKMFLLYKEQTEVEKLLGNIK